MHPPSLSLSLQVIFSSTSDIAGPDHSLTSSESTSAIDKEDDEQDFTGHRYFDFLDGEEENNPAVSHTLQPKFSIFN